MMLMASSVLAAAPVGSAVNVTCLRQSARFVAQLTKSCADPVAVGSDALTPLVITQPSVPGERANDD